VALLGVAIQIAFGGFAITAPTGIKSTTVTAGAGNSIILEHVGLGQVYV
jgi:hypothetical protein